MPSHEIIFASDGTGRCLYTEAIDLSAVGRLAIARATTIEFDAAAQRWVVRTPEGVERFRHARREACVAWVHAALEAAETDKHESHQQGDHALYQPVYLGERDEIDADDCTLERQHLKYKPAA